MSNDLIFLCYSVSTVPDALAVLRERANTDPVHKKVFVRGLAWETTVDSLRTCFSPYGELEDVILCSDRSTGKSKGYGFVIFKEALSAYDALAVATKQIDVSVKWPFVYVWWQEYADQI